jgi:hypothetical protein
MSVFGEACRGICLRRRGSRLGGSGISQQNETGDDRAPSALAAREFLEAFENQFGSLECDRLRRDCMNKSEEMYKLCSNYVHFAVTAVEEAVSK